MCDYCDCRAQPEIAGLSADHELLLSMTAALRRSLAAGLSIEAHHLDELADLLLPHTEREEVGVFTALRDVGVEADYVIRFEDDHRQIEELMASAAGVRSAVGPLIELVEDHFLREETDLFPARQLLAPDRWDAVEQRVSQPC